MDIEFRELVAILKIDAPVHFTPKEMLNKKDYVYCKFMGEEECAAITAGKHDPLANYDDSDIGLHFPDIKWLEPPVRSLGPEIRGVSTPLLTLSCHRIGHTFAKKTVTHLGGCFLL